MSVIHSYEIDEEIGKLTRMTDDFTLRRLGIAWFEVLGKLPPNDYEGRSRVGRLLEAIDARRAGITEAPSHWMPLPRGEI